MNLQLREQPKTISYTYRLLYQSFRITAKKNLQLIHKENQLKYSTKDKKSSMHNYTTKIRNNEKRWVQMQDTGDELAIKRTTT